MRFFIDEDLTPALCRTIHQRNYDATCVRDREGLAQRDDSVMDLCFQEDRICVTANAGDFTELCRSRGLHPGLVVMEGGATRERQIAHIEAAINHIQRRAEAEGSQPASWMVNRVVEVSLDSSCADYPLPDTA